MHTEQDSSRKALRERPLGKSRSRCEDNINKDLEETGCKLHSSQSRTGSTGRPL